MMKSKTESDRGTSTAGGWRSPAAFAGLALVLGLALSVTCARAEIRDPKGVAVVVGNRNYRNERVPEVNYAHRDAAAFRHYVVEVLGYDPDNIIYLEDADQAKLESVFGNERSHEGLLWRYLDPEGGSDVVVFYSGHGVPGLKDKRSYLLPVNADPDTAEINGYPIDVLYGNLSKLKEARSVRVFLDACFSGDSDRGMLVRAASPVYVKAELPEAEKKLTALTAASGQELASWDEKAEHGLFTHHLLAALHGAADDARYGAKDGKVTAAEAKRYLDRHMTRAARRTFGRHQRATLAGDEGVVLAEAVGDSFPVRPPIGATIGKTSRTPVAVEVALSLDREAKVLVQRGLGDLKYDAGPADGLFGKKTRGAIKAWQRAKGFRATGYLTAEQAEALRAVGEESTREQVAGAQAGRERETRSAAKDEVAREAKENKNAENGGDAIAGDVEGEVRSVDKPREDLGALSADSSLRAKVEEMLTRALDAFQRVDHGLRSYAYASLAEVQAEAGDTQGAARSISIATSHADDDADFMEIVRALATMGDFREAERIAAKLRGFAGCSARVTLARQRTARKDEGAQRSLLAAIDCADELSGAFEKTSVFSSIAGVQANGGNTMGANRSFSRALSAARRMPEEDYMKSIAIVSLAEAQARAGDAQGAAQSISRALALPGSRLNRVSTLISIAELHARLGNHQAAKPMILRAQSLAEGLSENLWGWIASAQAQIGEFDAAMRTAARTTSIHSRDNFFHSIAVAQVKGGDPQAGMRSAEKITSNFLRGAVYLEIARHHLAEGASK